MLVLELLLQKCVKKVENTHEKCRKQLEDSEHVVTSDPFGTFASKFAIGIRKFSDIAQIIQTCFSSWGIFFFLTPFCNPKNVKKLLHSVFIFKHQMWTLVTYKFHPLCFFFFIFRLCISFRCLICLYPSIYHDEFLWSSTTQKEM